ncbi:Shikimate kinase OS=Rhizobacter sp. Root404 OX=1736528 GN=aroK PE=3 SV=1 [Rhizobacter fulvus]|jgi:XRE family aerobic/anaerobic benzoate catabolism transcriptional regulator
MLHVNCTIAPIIPPDLHANPKTAALDLSESHDRADADDRDPFLAALGERTRALRARRGLTRKGLAKAADVSERHLANVEMGVGNASVQFLRQMAQALNCSLAELVGDETASSPEWLMIRALLRGRSEADLVRARAALAALFDESPSPSARRERIALIGLRGAGKSTLGRALAEGWGVPFIELNRGIEALAGCTLPEIHSLYGPIAYRRYERRAMEEAIARHPRAVIATPGGIVSDPGTFNLLLANCYTVWVRATPEEHMSRVLAQGDTRPMAGNVGNAEAMNDLRRILESRAAFYSKADTVFDSSDMSPAEAVAALREQLTTALAG